LPFAAADLVGVDDPERAQTNYMLNCQGCHRHDGAESPDGAVPGMRDFIGHFLSVPGGREFLVQVPGSANAAISNAELAELLNWLLQRISREQLPDAFSPYTETEVAHLRRTPEDDVVGTRATLVRAIESLDPTSPKLKMMEIPE
jgi:hypothetical protein|tara:strand:- start:558 stop:992 length:435 start_codon:yes stop_codon:yes gene_type:complete